MVGIVSVSESNGDGKAYHVFLGVPNAGNIMPCCLTGISQATRKYKMVMVPSQFGDICQNFNILWTMSLNLQEQMQITHWAMLHTDIEVSSGWLDTLIEEMDRVDADVMSAIVAIKDARGLTTTGLRTPGLWGTRRYTMREVMALPETFCIDDLDEPDQVLAINTGCWVCRFPAHSWPTKFPGFCNDHRIRWRDGEAQPEFDSEDWKFSDWAASQGLRVFVTRKVGTAHVGAYKFGNDTAWGSLQTDEWRPKWPSMEAEELEAEQVWSLSAAAPASGASSAGTIRLLRPAGSDLHPSLVGSA